MAGSVAAERHLCLNLTEIHEKENIFLLDAPISQTGLFGEAVSSVVEKFRSAKSQSAALKQFMPRRMRDSSSTPSTSLPRERSLPRKEPTSRSYDYDYGLGSPRPPFSPLTTPQTSGPEAARQAFCFTLRSGQREHPQKPQEARPDRSNVSACLQHALLTQVCTTHPQGFVHQHQPLSVWHSGDASGFLPQPPVPSLPAARGHFSVQ